MFGFYKFNLSYIYQDYPELMEEVGNSGRDDYIRTNAFQKYPMLFSDHKKNNDDIKVLGLINSKRQHRFIKRQYIDKHENLEKYKVLVPKSNGSGAIGEVLSTPVTGHTQTFISIGAFETEFEAEACLKYVKSKFARVLLGILKVTQDNPPATWKYVPLQDFTIDSDIDWSKGIPEIDQQLYVKYGLDLDEIKFIETNIQAMD